MKNSHLLIILILVFINSCKKTNLQIKGHWHLESISKRQVNFFELNPYLDFENDSIVVLGKLEGASDGIIGNYNKEQQTIKFEYLHRGINDSFNIEIKSSESIVLTLNEGKTGNKIYQATKCDSICCDKQIHYFSMIDVDLDLPVKSSNDEYIQRQEKSLEFSIFIGKPKKHLQPQLGNNYQIVFNNKISEINEIHVSENNFKLKVPESKRKRIRRIIYADKGTPSKTIDEIIKYYKSINQNRVFLALRDKDTDKGIGIYLKKINDFKSNGNETLTEWLKSE